MILVYSICVWHLFFKIHLLTPIYCNIYSRIIYTGNIIIKYTWLWRCNKLNWTYKYKFIFWILLCMHCTALLHGEVVVTLSKCITLWYFPIEPGISGNMTMSRCVFGVGSCLVGYVYSRGLVLFWASLPVSRLHSWSPVMSVFYFETTLPSRPPHFRRLLPGLRSFHVRFLPSRLTRFQAVPHLHGHYLLWIM